jgi:hypothetical protein
MLTHPPAISPVTLSLITCRSLSLSALCSLLSALCSLLSTCLLSSSCLWTLNTVCSLSLSLMCSVLPLQKTARSTCPPFHLRRRTLALFIRFSTPILRPTAGEVDPTLSANLGLHSTWMSGVCLFCVECVAVVVAVVVVECAHACNPRQAKSTLQLAHIERNHPFESTTNASTPTHSSPPPVMDPADHPPPTCNTHTHTPSLCSHVSINSATQFLLSRVGEGATCGCVCFFFCFFFFSLCVFQPFFSFSTHSQLAGALSCYRELSLTRKRIRLSSVCTSATLIFTVTPFRFLPSVGSGTTTSQFVSGVRTCES